MKLQESEREELKPNILVCGGDLRMLYAARALAPFANVKIIGFLPEKVPPEFTKFLQSPDDSNEKIDALLLPPKTIDKNGCIPSMTGGIPLENIRTYLASDGIVFGGIDGGTVQMLCLQQMTAYYDYINSNALALANAVPTAEGALILAIQESKRTIWGCNALVLGGGRIAQALTLRLHALGAKVTAAARKEDARMHLQTFGAQTLPLPLPHVPLSEYDVIFNTVPHVIFSREELARIRQDCILIELASEPGGFDRKSAQEIGCRLVCAPGLPLHVRC